MGDDQRQTLARMFAENAEFKAAFMGATSAEDAVRIAGEHGIQASVEDFMPPEGLLSDVDLEVVGGGTEHGVPFPPPTFVPSCFGL